MTLGLSDIGNSEESYRLIRFFQFEVFGLFGEKIFKLHLIHFTRINQQINSSLFEVANKFVNELSFTPGRQSRSLADYLPIQKGPDSEVQIRLGKYKYLPQYLPCFRISTWMTKLFGACVYVHTDLLPNGFTSKFAIWWKTKEELLIYVTVCLHRHAMLSAHPGTMLGEQHQWYHIYQNFSLDGLFH